MQQLHFTFGSLGLLRYLLHFGYTHNQPLSQPSLNFEPMEVAYGQDQRFQAADGYAFHIVGMKDGLNTCSPEQVTSLFLAVYLR